MEIKTLKKEKTEEEKITAIIRRKTIFSFSILFLAFGLAYGGWKWLYEQPEVNGVVKPLRAVLAANEKVNAVVFNEKHLVKEYPKSKAVKKARVNGDVGMGEEFDPSTWKLNVRLHPEKPDSVIFLSLAEIKTLPKKEIIFDFKCIEGWDQVTHWGGTSFFNFMKKYKLGTKSGNAPDIDHPEDLYAYVGLMTPDSAYYVGIDMKSMLHEQTLLCYEHNGKDLPMEQGYPLRLIIPLKYGVKSLKRIAYIYFSDTRPKDYWFEQGYDYDCAL